MKDRKAFSFYRSYYETAEKLPEEERLQYLWGIIQMQFTGEEPEGLSLMADLAFSATKHSVKKQLEGYKHGAKGGRPPKGKDNPPLKGTSNQEQEKGEEQEQDKEEYIHALVLWLLDNCPNVQKMKQPINNKEAERIVTEFCRAAIREVFDAMDNTANLRKKYVSANKTFRSWMKLRQQKNPKFGKIESTTYLGTA